MVYLRGIDEFVGADHPINVRDNCVGVCTTLFFHLLSFVVVEEGWNRVDSHLPPKELIFVKVHLNWSKKLYI